jgi:hypothetical protein
MGTAGTVRAGGSIRGQASALKSRHPRFVDMAGQVVGHWTVANEAPGDNIGACWNCVCGQCGETQLIYGSELRTRAPQCMSCGKKSKRGDKWPTKYERKPVASKPAPLRALDLDEVPVFRHLVRCSTCQSFQGFVGGRCLNCGRGTSEMLPHVVGPQRREHV